MTTSVNGKWTSVSASRCCPVCGKPDWCRVSADGVLCACRRQDRHPSLGAGERKTDQSGGEYWLYRLVAREAQSGGAWQPPRYSMADGKGERAAPDTLHRVYSALLDRLPLMPQHKANLEIRGLKVGQKAAGYRSLGRQRARAAHDLVKAGLEELLPRVPGFHVQEKNGRRFWSLTGMGGLLVPVRDSQRRIVALLTRLDEPPAGKGKYRYFSSKQKGGPGPGAPVHFPLFTGDTATVRVTEGALKADIATALSGMLTIGLPGVSMWQRAAKALRQVRARTARLSFDADARTNRHVAGALCRLAQHLLEHGFTVEVERWNPADGKGIDDALAAGKTPEVLTGDAAFAAIREWADATGAEATGVTTEDERPQITITTEEHEVNAQAVEALQRDPDVYQRGGQLVRIVRDASPAAHGIRRPYAPRIDAFPQPLLRERLAANARWVVLRETKEGTVLNPARPPAWCVAAVHGRASWPGIRHLEAVVDYPVLRPDGTILSTPGYDPTTGLLLEPAGTVPTLLDRPTLDDARNALAILLEVVADFPFEREEHKAAWLAALLTPLARFAFVGPSPLFLVDANVRAAGKGLLLDAISRIATGERFTIAAYTADEDELRKRITSLVLAGDRLVLFDNLEGKFGNAVLDAALTGTAWKDRVLGVNRVAEAPLYMSWYATGNNVLIAADTARRVCHIRLESPEERPEERQDFRHTNLLAWVGENRGKLLAAALTILRAYCVAGRPDQHLPAWGSFEGWSALVRSAVVWVGMPDPGKTRLLLQAQADVTAESMAVLLACWKDLDPDRRGLTAAEVIHQVYKAAPDNLPRWHADLRDALDALLGKPDARGLGTKLRSFRRRVFRGLFIDQVGKEHKAVRWAVYPADQFRTRPGGATATPQSAGECGGCGESIPPQARTANAADDAGQSGQRPKNTPHTPHTPPAGSPGESGECVSSEAGIVDGDSERF
jgi:hypothetical protein